MSNKKDLKAFVRYDGTGRVISGSLILQRNKPKVGNWNEVQAYECCDPSCPNSVYGRDWIIYSQDEVETGVIFHMAVNPFEYNIKLQFQLVNCDGQPIGGIITIDQSTEYEYDWFIPVEIFDGSCGLRTRRVCGFNYTSAWSDFIGG